jgi:predicted Zn-dependent peptidase
VTLGDYRWFWWHQEALRAVTAADVRAVAARVLRASNRTVVVGRPAEAS